MLQFADLGKHRIEAGGQSRSLIQRAKVRLESDPYSQILDALGIGPIPSRFAGLGLYASNPLTDLIDEILEPVEIVLCSQQGSETLSLPEPVLRDTGRLFKNYTPVGIGRLQKNVDFSLLEDRVGGRSEAGIQEEILDVLEATAVLVDEIFALTASKQPSGDGNLREVDVEIPLCIIEDDSDLGVAQRLAILGSTEDDVHHLSPPQTLGRLAAKNPLEGIDDIGLSAAIGTDNSGYTRFEIEARSVSERFEAYEF